MSKKLAKLEETHVVYVCIWFDDPASMAFGRPARFRVEGTGWLKLTISTFDGYCFACVQCQELFVAGDSSDHTSGSICFGRFCPNLS